MRRASISPRAGNWVTPGTRTTQDTYNWLSGLVPPLQQWSYVALVISPQSAVIYLCNTSGVQSATNAIAHTAEAFELPR